MEPGTAQGREYIKRIQSWTDEHETARRCPLCGSSRQWEVTAPGNIALRDGNGLLSRRVLPVVPLVCADCGHVALLSAVKAGVLLTGPEETP